MCVCGLYMSVSVCVACCVQEQMREYPLIGCLVVVLKQFLIYHNLLESFNGGISSYCLILLILSYLQVTDCRHRQVYMAVWLGSQVVSVLDSGAEGPGFKSQS